MTNLKRLEQLVWERDCSRTQMRPDYVPRTKFEDKTANGLTKSVVTWINLHGGFAERINTMGRYLPGKSIGVGMYGVKQLKGKYIPTTSTRGSSDVSATINGRSVKIEIKIGKDKQSEAQKEYELNTIASGGLYWIVKTFDEFVEQWKGLVG